MESKQKRIKIKEDIFDRINGTTSTKNTPSNLQETHKDSGRIEKDDTIERAKLKIKRRRGSQPICISSYSIDVNSVGSIRYFNPDGTIKIILPNKVRRMETAVEKYEKEQTKTLITRKNSNNTYQRK